MRVWLAGLGMAVLPMAALAQEVDCAKAEVQVELNFCAEQDWQVADAELNAAYKLAMAAMKEIDAALPEDQRGAAAYLRQAQRDWIAYRDNACAAEGFMMRGGSAEPMLIYGCLARLTEERTLGLYALTEGGG